MKNPGTILRLWTKAVKKHEEGKKPDELPKKGQERKLTIKNGLTKLKLEARNDMADEKARAAFTRVRDRTAKAMQDYCRYLKAAKDEDKKALPRYLKAVKQLTVVVKKLDPGSLDPNEEEVGLEALEAVDEKEVAALDEALEQPAEDEEAEAEDLAEEEAAPPGAAAGDGAARFTARLKALLPAIQKAQGDNTPAAQEIKLRVSQANVFARKKDFAQANDLLDDVESLLKETQTGETNGAQAGDRPGKPPSLVVLQQSRLAWDQTRKVIQAELQKLEKSVVGTCQGDEEVDVAEVSGNVKRLYTILDNLDTRLSDKLDEALNAADPKPRAQLHQQARGIIGEYLAFVNGDALMADIDDNGFTPVAVRKTALNALNLLSSKL
jgi:hypothetical protein